MGTCNQLALNETRHRLTQPSASGGPVATEGREHGEGVDGALPLRPSSTGMQSKDEHPGLAERGQRNRDDALSTCLSATESDGLETMGVRAGDSSAAVARKVPVRAKPKRGRQRVPSDGSVNQETVLQLLERQQYRCALTDQALTPESASLDHIVPVCRGGEHRIENTQVLERTVNRAKGTLSNEEFIALCGKVWRHAGLASGANPSMSQKQN